MVISCSFPKSDITQTDTYQVLFDKGLLRLRTGRYKEALTYFDRAIAIIPDQVDPAPWYQRGEVLAHLTRYSEALDSFDQALVLEPEHQQSWAFRGAVLIQLKQYAEALQSCNRALTLQPNDAETWVVRGTALHYLKRYQQAYASFDRALSLEPKPPSKQGIKPNLLFIKHFIKQSRMPLVCTRLGKPTKIGRQTNKRKRGLFRQPQIRVRLSGWEISTGFSVLLITAIVFVELTASLQGLEPGGKSEFHNAGISWWQAERDCQQSGRGWENNICRTVSTRN